MRLAPGETSRTRPRPARPNESALRCRYVGKQPSLCSEPQNWFLSFAFNDTVYSVHKKAVVPQGNYKRTMNAQ
jgi:hypothetical protein